MKRQRKTKSSKHKEKIKCKSKKKPKKKPPLTDKTIAVVLFMTGLFTTHCFVRYT